MMTNLTGAKKIWNAKKEKKKEKEWEGEREWERKREEKQCKQLDRSYKVVFAKFVSLVLAAAESSRKIVPEKT